ncbi:MAG: type IV secretion system protein [Synergistaceae bacterium]|jgi:type IV secretion system protein VirB5|nr:type IV secretion system protein [Synergistaceae bacterium]
MGLFSRREKKTPILVKADNSALSLEAIEKTGQEAFENSPWQQAKEGHMGIYMSLASSAAQWRTGVYVMMILLALSVGCNVYLANSVRVRPYIIQVDRHGYAIPVKMTEVANVDQRVILAQVGQFIFNSRTRVMDRQAQLLFSEDAYRSVARNSEASKRLDNYFRGAPPTRAAHPVLVQLESILPFSRHTYQAKWEEVTESDALTLSTSSYTGLFTVAISPPTDMENLLSNPMGIYITDYSIETDTLLN